MKKILMIIMIVSTVFVMAACGKTQNKSTGDNSLENVKKAGKLTIGVDDSYPPMEFRDEKNTLLGFDIDFANALCKKLGVKPEFIPTDWNGIIMSLNNGKFNTIISSLSITEERKKSISFSKPYIVGGQIVALKSNNNEVKTVEELKGKTIGCQLGSTGEEAAVKIKGTKLVKKYDKITEAFHDLDAGRIEAVIVDEPVGDYYMSKKKDAFKVMKEKLSKEPQGIGIKSSDKELTKAIDKAIDELKKEGTLSKISLKWFGKDIYKE